MKLNDKINRIMNEKLLELREAEKVTMIEIENLYDELDGTTSEMLQSRISYELNLALIRLDDIREKISGLFSQATTK